ncbi:nitroreductase family protein [Leuconostoc carnosum]|uniref:nitroreductase family protein n=1 Tax=Leuconostoc carnosum TaxID=1252 RepID=UPI0037BFC359
MMMSFTDLQEKRRSIYVLGDNVSQTPEELFELVKSAVKHAPTAFNNQTVRTVVLFGEKKDQLWDITADRLKSEVPTEAAYQNTLEKLNSFKAGVATVLFYSDTDVVKTFEENIPLYSENFYDRSEQGHGIAEYATWLAVTEAGLGANIQHYNPLIDEPVAKAFDIPAHWRLRAQLNIGSIEEPASIKEYMTDDDRFKLVK